ncbi:MAG: hypothetical protein AAF657_25045 [Acidobacteriota bacterium]
MMRLATTVLLLAALGLTPAPATADLEVIAATGVVAPEGLQSGQTLSAGTRLELESWGRALVRETTGCGLTHIVVGLEEYSLAPTDNCAPSDEAPPEVAARIQRGEQFAVRVKETESSPFAQLVLALGLDPCVYLARVSEEPSNVRQCPSGHALRGLRCTGSWCDNKDLMCCPYLEGAADPSAEATQARQISEEFPNVMTSKKFLDGLTCWGPYCDNVKPSAFKSSRLTNTKKCDWSAWDSDRPSAWLVCDADQFIAGLRCRSDYCGDIGVYCCQAKTK